MDVLRIALNHMNMKELKSECRSLGKADWEERRHHQRDLGFGARHEETHSEFDSSQVSGSAGKCLSSEEANTHTLRLV
jgi:hypothetical protein